MNIHPQCLKRARYAEVGSGSVLGNGTVLGAALSLAATRTYAPALAHTYSLRL